MISRSCVHRVAHVSSSHRRGMTLTSAREQIKRNKVTSAERLQGSDRILLQGSLPNPMATAPKCPWGIGAAGEQGRQA